MSARASALGGWSGSPSVRSWVRQNLFGGPLDSLITIALVLGALYAVAGILDWAVLSATFSAASAQSCRLAAGACWPILLDNLNLLLFGTFPADLRWRAAAPLLIFLAVVPLLLLPATRPC